MSQNEFLNASSDSDLNTSRKKGVPHRESLHQDAQHQGLIIGGGIGGLALALFLQRAGIAATVYEAYPAQTSIGGGLSLAPNGMNVLDALGLAETLQAQGALMEKFSFRNHTGRILAEFSAGCRETYGQPAVALPRATLLGHLQDEAVRQDVPIVYEKRLARFVETQEGITAFFEDGTSAQGSFLVGADGIHSQVREQILADDGPAPSYTGAVAIGGFVADSNWVGNPRDDAAKLVLMFGLNGSFGYCNRSPNEEPAWMWWSTFAAPQVEAREAFMAQNDDEIRRQLLEKHQEWAEPVVPLLRNTPRVIRVPIYDVPVLPAWSAGHAVLMGDAAHAMSPHAGQGASIALEDAHLLAQLIEAYPHALAQAFVHFEAARKARAEKISAQARQNAQRQAQATPMQAWIRDKMLALFMPLFGARSQHWIYSYRAQVDVAALDRQ